MKYIIYTYISSTLYGTYNDVISRDYLAWEGEVIEINHES